MGWFEWLSDCDKSEGARHASVAEQIEYRRYRDHHPALKADEALEWKGCLFTGYHLHKTKKGPSTRYIKTDGSDDPVKIND
jgi:hypothetical protein